MRKSVAGHAMYMLLMLAAWVAGSVLLHRAIEQFRSDVSAAFTRSLVLVAAIAFPMAMGVALGAERYLFSSGKTSYAAYHWARFWGITCPLGLLLAYYVLSMWVAPQGVRLPVFPTFGMNDLYLVLAFGIGYSGITNLVPREKEEDGPRVFRAEQEKEQSKQP